VCLLFSGIAWAEPFVSARAYAVVDADDGHILSSKNPHLKLPPASTTKVMTVLLAKEKLSGDDRVLIGRNAANAAPSKAGLTAGAQYTANDLMTACLVSSSNDAAVALAEAVAGSESAFAKLMNAKARSLGMKDTQFVNATGLTDKRRKQYTTAYDLTLLMREAIKDRRLDDMMGITNIVIAGSDAKRITLRTHNKMLWRIPKFVKGKTGWTYASRHTFVGTNYAPDKSITFAMLSSQKPWSDIERLASFGLVLERRR
jgi:serine-type D-Ala-D-Ala carboxypeptidase (penicillin-binding protein 5/6)